MVAIFKAKDQFVESILYDGSDDSFKQIKKFVERYNLKMVKNDAGYILIENDYKTTGFEIITPGVVFLRFSNEVMTTMEEGLFKELFFKPKTDHN